MQKSIKTSIVGMQHQANNPEIIYRLTNGSPITLKPEPENPHDKNAVAAFIDGHRIGYVRAIHAKTISPALRSYSCTASTTIKTPSNVLPNTKSIDVEITLTGITPSSPPPKIAQGKTPGIYKISVGQKVYIGQSSDINKRISTHWKDLALGSHANKNLQKLWLDLGPYAFHAEAMLIAPSGLSPYELQEWLGHHEYKEIKIQQELGTSLNILDGEIVRTKYSEPDKILVQKERLKNHDAGVRERKLEINAEIEKLSSEISPMRSERQNIMTQLQIKKDLMYKNSGLIGVFRGSLNRYQKEHLRATIEKLEKQIASIDQKISPIQTRIHELKTTIKTLKTAKQKAHAANRRLGKHFVRSFKPEDFV